MNKIKEICDKYGITHRVLGIMTGYSESHIQKVATGKRPIIPRLEHFLDGIIKGLEHGDIKIPE